MKHTIQSLLNEEEECPSSSVMEEQVASAKALLSLSKQKQDEEQKQVPLQKEQQTSDSWVPSANCAPTAPFSYPYPSQYYHAPMHVPPIGMLSQPAAPPLYYPPHSYNNYYPPHNVQPQYMMPMPQPPHTSYPLPPHQPHMMSNYPSSAYYSMPSAYGTSTPVNTHQVASSKVQTTNSTISSSTVVVPPPNLNTNSPGVSVVNISDESVAKSYKVKEVESKYVKGKVFVVDPKSKKKDIAPNTALFHITQSLLRDKFKVDATSNIKLVSKKGGKIHVVHDCKQSDEETQKTTVPNQ